MIKMVIEYEKSYDEKTDFTMRSGREVFGTSRVAYEVREVVWVKDIYEGFDFVEKNGYPSNARITFYF